MRMLSYVALMLAAVCSTASASTFQHPMRFGQAPGYWWPAADLVQPETGPDPWPWDANVVNDTFRVLSTLDRDGDERVYDARWAAAINIWRDWNNNQGPHRCPRRIRSLQVHRPKQLLFHGHAAGLHLSPGKCRRSDVPE